MPMIPISSDSEENVGVLVMDQEHVSALVSALFQTVDGVEHTDPLRLFPTIIDGKITKLEVIKPDEHAN